MAISLKDVEHLALLARLAISEEEKQMFHEQLSNILDYFDVLQDLDVSDIPPTAGILPQDTVLRADEVDDSVPPEVLLRNVDEANHEGDQYRVDAILEDAE